MQLKEEHELETDDQLLEYLLASGILKFIPLGLLEYAGECFMDLDCPNPLTEEQLKDYYRECCGLTDFMMMDAWDTPATTAYETCRRDGHDLVDCGHVVSESGNADHECIRCGEYFLVPLY